MSPTQFWAPSGTLAGPGQEGDGTAYGEGFVTTGGIWVAKPVFTPKHNSVLRLDLAIPGELAPSRPLKRRNLYRNLQRCIVSYSKTLGTCCPHLKVLVFPTVSCPAFEAPTSPNSLSLVTQPGRCCGGRVGMDGGSARSYLYILMPRLFLSWTRCLPGQ